MPQPKKSTLTEIDTATRDRVIASANGKCWLCSLYGKYVTRVIDEPDLVLHHDLQRRGFIHMPNLNAFENLLYLCPNCHSGFDDRVPIWAFLPIDLDGFISCEKRFQEHRKAAAAAGKPFPRVLDQPGAITPLLYTRYQILPGYLFTQIFTNTPAQPWLGSPVAAVIRSARLISGHGRLPVEEGGMPMDVALKFQHLLLLYGTPEPQILLKTDEILELPVNNPDMSKYPVKNPPDRPKHPVDNGPDLPERPADNHSHPPEKQPDLDLPKRLIVNYRDVPKHLFDNPPTLPKPLDDNAPPTPKESPFDDISDFSLIGQAFHSAIKYVNDNRNCQNMNPQAQAWLTAAVGRVVSTLKQELRSLHAHIVNSTPAPEPAVHNGEDLMLNSGDFPYALTPYRAEFEDYLLQLLASCGLHAISEVYVFGGNCILLSVTFPPGAIYSESQTVGNRIFDPEVEKGFLRGVQSVRFEKR